MAGDGSLAAMLSDLLASPGVTEAVDLRGPAGIMALHGGLEAGTDAIAAGAAAAAAASSYRVVLPDDLAWHVPSTRFDPAESDRLRRFLEHVRVAISVHGFGRRGLERTVLVGGGNRRLAGRVAGALRRHTSLSIVDDVERMPRGLRGLHPRNPVNLPARGGVQLELSPGAREPEAAAGIVAAVASVLRSEQRSLCRAAPAPGC